MKIAKHVPSLSPDRFSRRAVLQRLGVGAAMLPLIHAERAEAATATGFPKRFISITWPSGVLADSFYSQAPGTDLELKPTLQPLAPWKSKVLMVAGLDISAGGGQVGGHGSFPAILTGTSKINPMAQAGAPGSQVSTGPSIDQIISDDIATRVTLPVPRLTIGAGPFGNFTTTSQNATGKNPAEIYPQRVYTKLFGGASLPPAQIDNLRLRRKSVLDFVNGELGNFKTRLGTEDRAKIDAHLQSVRALELDLDKVAAPQVCVAPARGTDYTYDEIQSSQAYPGIMKAFFDLTAVAIKCDLTRSVTVTMLENGGAQWLTFPFGTAGARGLHDIAHFSEGETRPLKLAADLWAYGMIANFIKQLDETQESGGSALDHSVVLVNSDMASGQNHTGYGAPFLIIGSGGGYFKTDRCLRFGTWATRTGAYWGDGTSGSGVPHGKLLTTVCQAMDVPINQVGSVAGTLAGLAA